MYLGFPYSYEQKETTGSDENWKELWPKKCQNQACQAMLVEGAIPVAGEGEIQIRVMKCPNGCEN